MRVKGTELLLEIQLHLECMYKLKTEVATNKGKDGKTGHERYVEFRQLKEGAELLGEEDEQHRCQSKRVVA